MAETVARLKEKLVPYICSSTYIECSVYFLVSMLLACAGENGLAPFGAAAVAAAWFSKRTGHFPAALAGALTGSVITAHWPAACAMALYPLLGMACKALKKSLTRTDKLMLICVAKLFVMPIFSFTSTAAAFTATIDIALTAASAAVLEQADRAVFRALKRYSMGSLQKAAVCALLMMLAASFNDAAAGGVRFGVVFAAFAALCAAQGNGIAAVVAAVALGAGRAIAGDGLALMGTLALCTLCGGALNGFNRMAVASGFVISAFSAAAYLGSEGAIGIFETAIAAVMFLVVPHRWLNFIRMRDEDRAGRKAQRTLEDMRDRLYMTAEVIEQLTRLYEEKEAVSPDKEAIGFARRQLASVSAVLKRTAEGERRRCYNFDVQVGAAGCAKFGSEETGDSMAVKELDSSILMMISDGMGTGAQARSESSAATELLTRLLSVGFELDEALECLNRILMAYNSGEDMYATLDALVFDRLNAGAKFVKFGAPPSYVIRSGKVHTLYSEALPAGILEQASPAVHSVNLKRGDTIVLMSDGTADALGSGLIATLAERVCSANTATDAAEAVLCAAREYGEDDDMSVMVARVS